jgi:hypothetical protein
MKKNKILPIVGILTVLTVGVFAFKSKPSTKTFNHWYSTSVLGSCIGSNVSDCTTTETATSCDAGALHYFSASTCALNTEILPLYQPTR